MLYEVITNPVTAKQDPVFLARLKPAGTDLFARVFFTGEYHPGPPRVKRLIGPEYVITSYSIHYTKLYDTDGQFVTNEHVNYKSPYGGPEGAPGN